MIILCTSSKFVENRWEVMVVKYLKCIPSKHNGKP